MNTNIAASTNVYVILKEAYKLAASSDLDVVSVLLSEFIEVKMEHQKGHSIQVTDPKTGVRTFLYKHNRLEDIRYYEWCKEIADQVLIEVRKRRNKEALEREKQVAHLLSTVRANIEEEIAKYKNMEFM